MRRGSTVAAASALLACVACGSQGDAPARAVELSLLVANIGNLDGTNDGDCGPAPYLGSLCSVEEELAIADRIQARAPDVVLLMEVLDADLCGEELWGSPSEFLCSGAPERDPYQSMRRLVGDGYTIACDGIAHYDCIALAADRIAIEECEPFGTCIGASDTPPHPDACAEIGSISSVSRVHATIDGAPINLVVAHPLNARTEMTDMCRAAQYEQAFSLLADGDINLIAGDMNYDPYRFRDLGWGSSEYWHSVIGEGERFRALSVQEDPPRPTWMGVATLDYVVSDAFRGACQILGVTPGTDFLDAPYGHMDHSALDCELWLPE